MLTTKQEMKNIFWIITGSLIYVIGLNLFLVPIGLYTTGLMGFAQILATIVQTTLETNNYTAEIYFMLNIPIIILGWYKVGKKFTMRTFLAVILISVFQMIVPNDLQLVDDPLLATITSGVFIGTGIGITLKNGSSTGGTDIVALYISLFKGKSFGLYNLLLNVIVIIGALLVTQDVTVCILMIVSLYTIGVVIDRIHNSNEKVTLFIMSSHAEDVTKKLLEETSRGVTVIDSRGGMTGRRNNTIIVTIDKGQMYQALTAVKEADEQAFINIMPVENVVGFFPNNYQNIL